MAIDPLDFLDTSESSDPLDFLGQDVSKGRSLASAPLKGLIKGASKFSPIPSFGPVSQKLGERVTEQMLPTREGGLEDILEFSGENLPLAAFGEGGLAKKGLQALTGGLAKSGAKELNLPEWAQDVLGGMGMITPSTLESVLSKSINPGNKQKAIVDFLRSKGLSDREITPLIQNEKKLALLSKAAMKYQEKSPFLKGVQDKLGNIYHDIRAQGQVGKYLQGPELKDFESKFYKTLDKLPKRHSRLIEKEIEELFNNPIEFTNLHDFNVAVNDVIKGATGGKASIGKLKAATHEAQKALDPSLYSELRTADKAYSNLMNFTDRMSKKNWANIIKLGDAGKLIMGGLMLNPATMGIGAKGMAIGAASSYALRQMLVNPRLQNMHKKLQQAVLRNNMLAALKLSEMMKSELENKISVEEQIKENSY